MAPDILPIHLAVHSLGVAIPTPDGIATRSAFGPYVEALADSVDRLSLVAYDPPQSPSGTEDMTEYVMRPHRGNIDFLSLGPKGTWREYPSRSKRVGEVVGRASGRWDVVLFRLVNRRAHLVFRANRCPRVVSIVGGSSLELVKKATMPPWQRLPRLLYALRAESHYRRILAASGLVFANGEELVSRYRAVAPGISLLRSSARRARHSYRAPDRLNGEEVRFLVVGQIRSDKGILQALDAFASMRSSLLPRSHLHVVGVGPELASMRAMAAERGLHGAVTFHGWIPSGDELFSLYRKMDVLLCLSEVDFLPRVVWEAMGNSVLVIATMVGSLPHAFVNGSEILLIDSSASENVEQAVRLLRQNPQLRRSILARAFERAKEATLEKVVGRLLAGVVDRWPELAERGLRAAESR